MKVSRFVFGYIVVLLSLYDGSWQTLIRLCGNQSRNSIIYESIMLIITGIVIPIFSAFFNSFIVITVLGNDVE